MTTEAMVQQEKKKKKIKKRKIVDTTEEQTEIQPEQVAPAPEAAPQKPLKKRKKGKKTQQAETPEAPEAPEQAETEPTTNPTTKANSREYCEKHCIVVYEATKETEAFPAITSFSDAPFPAVVMQSTKNFSAPTPIQAQSWPIVAAGRDMVGIAATGSGKTLAFLVPGFTHFIQYKAMKTPKGLVLAPTRELAQQIAGVADSMATPCGLKSICLFGGVPKHPQRDELRKGVHLVVATPGRLVDLIEEGAVNLSAVDFLVLDEADRMLDMGFEPSVRTIVNSVQSKEKRRTLMFSATWPETVQSLAQEFLNKAVCVTIGEAGATLAATHSVQQIVEIIEPFKRNNRLHSLLEKYHDINKQNRILIFALYKKEAARVSDFLWNSGWNVGAIHGDMTQQQREQAIAQFKDGSIPLLVATDVAARGLDVKGITHVINYSFPLTTEDYVHRIGRTGRAGEAGVAHTFFQIVADKQRAYELVQVLKEANQVVPHELTKFHSTAKRKEHPLYGNHGENKFGSADMSKKVHVTFDDSD